MHSCVIVSLTSRLLRLFVLVVTYVSVIPFAEAAASERNLAVASKEHRVALVIGNSAYAQGPLLNPVNDARAMAKQLRILGFDVVLRENLKARDIGAVYREFRSKIAPGGVALVFYAGHGVQFKGQNYFPTIDADIHSEEDVPLQSLNLGNLLDNMEEAKAGVSLVFLDACRDNPFARRFRSSTRGLAKVEAASGMLIHYATRPGSVASDGEGKNGTYTEALLAMMSQPGVPVEQMLKRVANRVVDKTKGKQEPWVEGSLRGDFYFVFQGPTAGRVQQSAVDSESEAWKMAERAETLASVELAYWDSVKDSVNPEEFRGYLESYPNGKFANLARIRLKATEAKPSSSSSSVSPPTLSSSEWRGAGLKHGFVNSRKVADKVGSTPDDFDKINKKIKSFAQQYGFGIIFQEAVYANRGIDITDYVIKLVEGRSFDGNELKSFPATGNRVGFVNSKRILNEVPDALAARKQIEKDFSAREQELQRMAKQGEDERFKKRQQEFKDDLSARQNKEMARIFEKVNAVIKQIAVANGYDIIFQEAVYADPRLDITESVLFNLKR